MAERIKHYYLNDYYLVDKAIEVNEKFDASIRSELFNYYWTIYNDILIEIKIDISKIENIQKKSDKIYLKMLEVITIDIFENRNLSIPIERRKTYLNAITAYVFYNCKFLIPIEEEKEEYYDC